MKTKDKNEGIRKAGIYNDFIEEYWRKLLTLKGDMDKKSEYKLAVKRAKIHGFTYKTAVEVAKSSVQEIVDRISEAKNQSDDQEVVSSVLGGEKAPAIYLSECLEAYWPLCSHKLVNKSDDQVRKWKNPRILSLTTFIDVVGDKSFEDLERTDTLMYRQWWLDRISSEDAAPSTANKNMAYLKEVLKEVTIANEVNLDVEALFTDLKLKQFVNSRPSFEAQYVQDTFLSDDRSLSGMNKEAKLLVYAMSDTGARISELIGLRQEDIVLDEDMPYIWIRPYKKHALKTPQSERKIPLVGASLYAFRELQKGFTHYTNPDTASSTVNKYLRENGLKPTPRHQLYSLRHTFKDRLRDAGAPEEVIDELMGHKTLGPKYGRGHLLEKKHEWLQKIAFDASALP